MKKNITIIILTIIILIAVGYIIKLSHTPEIVVAVESECTAEDGVWNNDKQTCLYDEGDFKLIIEEAQTEETVKYQTFLEEDGEIENIIGYMNEDFALPFDVDVVFTNCDEANAWYSSDTVSLTYCYELMQDVDAIYTELGYEGDELDVAIFNNTFATLYHEFGHAIIDIFNLPITGREEDVADQISTYVLLNSYEDEAGSVLDASEEYYVNAEKYPPEADSFADVHTPDLARYYNLVCWVYGSDEKKFSYLLDSTGITENRASGCADEYNQFKDSLEVLLAGFSK